MRIGYAVRLLVRRWVMISTAAVLLGLAGMMLGHHQARYATSAHVILLPTKGDQDLRAVNPQRWFTTQTERILDDDVLRRAALSTGDEITATKLRQDLSVTGGTESDVAVITATDSTAERSRADLDAILKALASSHLDSVQATQLWIGETTSTASAIKWAVEGALAGIALTSLGLLLVGAVRRPVLIPEDVALRDTSLRRFPRIVDPADANQIDQLATWLRADDSSNAIPFKVIAADARSDLTAQQLQARLDTPVNLTNDAGAVGSPQRRAGRDSHVVVLTTVGATTEAALEQVVALNPGASPALVLIAPKKRGRT